MELKQRVAMWSSLTTLSKDDRKTLEAMDQKALEESFYKELSFGTAGLRGKIGPGTNRMNEQVIARATSGLAAVIAERGEDAKARGVAIAWDVRKRSELFMKVAASVLAQAGIRVYVYEDIRPTPMVSFAVRELGTQAGIVITASHNPKEYNGYKVYWEEGSQIRDDIADEISEAIARLDYDITIEKDFESYREAGMIRVIPAAFEERYYDATLSKAIEDDIKKDISIVYTPLNGTGNLPVRRVLAARGFNNVHPVPEQVDPDPAFRSVGYPNPEDLHAFEKAIELGKTIDADLLIATDPDCDRVAAMVKDASGVFVPLTGNQMGALLLEYILSRRSARATLPENGAVVQSIVTGDLSKKVARRYGVSAFDSLTGFKNICALANRWDVSGEYEFLFGFEESIGYVYGDHVRDKDGVVTAMMIAEMAAYYLKQGKTLIDVLESMYRYYGYHGEKLVSFVREGQKGQLEIAHMMEDLRANPLREAGGLKVEKVVDYLEGIEGIGTSDVLEYHLEDGSRFTIRPSGTEPKIKLYIYAEDDREDRGKEKIGVIEETVIRRLNLV